MTIRNKISLLFTLLVTAILLVLNISIYYLSALEVREVFQKRLKSRASNNAQIFSYSGENSINILRKIDGGTLAMLPQKTVGIFDTSGQELYYYNSENADSLKVDKALLEGIVSSGERFFTRGERDVVGLYFEGESRNFIVLVAAYNVDGKEHLSQLKKILIFSLLIGVLVTLITGYVFSSQLVKPISSIIKDVNTISSHNLSKRLNAGSSKDELNQLAATFNELLDRLQDSFTTQRRFISNASHELSTPLTSISSQLQVTFQNERSVEEYKRVLHSIQDDVEQMRQLTKSLLEIARAGSQGSIELHELRIDELLLKVISDVKRINPDYKVEMQINNLPDDERLCQVFGNFDLLYSAIKNIIDNGCKYSPDKTSAVNVSFTDPDILISVENKGDIITESDIEQVFQPFFRGENTSEVKGFGLGLPLAKRIISIHKGGISVHSESGLTVFTITLPSLIKSKVKV